MQKMYDLVDDGFCFACGKSNPKGLKLEFVVEGDEYVTYFIPEKFHQGWEGIVHGGIVSTILDEVMARLVYFRGISAVTGEMSVRFRKPCPIGKKLRFAGKIESDEGRVIFTSAQATSPEGDILATANAKMVRVGLNSKEG